MGNLIVKLYRFLFVRQKFIKLNKFLFHISLNGLGVLNCANVKISGEWHLVKKILPKILNRNGSIFFDVGANIGNFTLTLLENFPNANIYAIEPHPKNYDHLKKKVANNKVKTYNVAMGESCSRLKLYDRADYDGSAHATLHKEVITEIHKQKVVSFDVDVETLDNFTEREGIKYIDFLKVDTEGNELSVLQGASKLIDDERIKCIYFEFNEMNIVSRVYFRDFQKILTNFEFYRLLPDGLLKLGDSPLETELFAFQNILALHKCITKDE